MKFGSTTVAGVRSQCNVFSNLGDVGYCEGYIVTCLDLIVFLLRGFGFVISLVNRFDPFGGLI